ncbi:MAG: hypothetical protein HYS74_01580 [Parcubacteria group bacterium]|nr:hypothetical protein [Parcubacteria group bacterium]
MRRLFANAILAAAVVFLPWWAAAIVGILALAALKTFYELIGWAFLIDLLYGQPVPAYFSMPFLLTVSSGIAVVGTAYARSQLRLAFRF